MKTRSVVLMCALALAGCEKSGSNGSGALSSEDTALLKDIPGGNIAVVGGNYMKLQSFMQSTFGKAVRDMTTKIMGSENDAMGKWMDCFTHFPKLKLVGGVASRPGGVEMRLVFSGMTVKDVAACATSAGYQNAVDADGKFVLITIPNALMKLDQGYIQLPDGALYMRQAMSLGGVPSVEPSGRAELEGDIAKLAKGTAADDKNLVALAAKADRSKTFWFAGNAANTPVGDKVGDVYGAFDLDDGVKIDVTVQVKESALADKVEDSISEVKKMADQLPADMRSIISDLKFHRSGDELHFVAKMTTAQIQSLSKMGAMGLGGM
jgi:hypothetical protein